MRDEGVDGAHRGGRVTVTSSAQMRCNNPGLVPFSSTCCLRKQVQGDRVRATL